MGRLEKKALFPLVSNPYLGKIVTALVSVERKKNTIGISQSFYVREENTGVGISKNFRGLPRKFFEIHLYFPRVRPTPR